jgi:hypothetical protein
MFLFNGRYLLNHITKKKEHMPIEHPVDTKTHLLRVRRWGHISLQEETQAFRERAEDPLVVPGMPVLVDCTGVLPPDSTRMIKYLADHTAKIAADLQCGPLALIVASDIEYGMARMYISYTVVEHPHTNVFRSEVEAMEWLSIKRKET